MRITISRNVHLWAALVIYDETNRHTDVQTAFGNIVQNTMYNAKFAETFQYVIGAPSV